MLVFGNLGKIRMKGAQLRSLKHDSCVDALVDCRERAGRAVSRLTGTLPRIASLRFGLVGVAFRLTV